MSGFDKISRANPEGASSGSFNKEDFIQLLQSYIHKLNTGTITPAEGLLLVEFYTKNHLQKDMSYDDSREDALSYAFLGYYLKELCKEKPSGLNTNALDNLTTSVD